MQLGLNQSPKKQRTKKTGSKDKKHEGGPGLQNKTGNNLQNPKP